MNSIIYGNRSLAYLKKKELNKALEDTNKSIDLNDKYVKSYIKRAEIKMQLQDYDGAIYDYNHVKELDPSQNVTAKIKEA